MYPVLAVEGERDNILSISFRFTAVRIVPTVADDLIDKIRALPPEKLGEVENFVDFLAAKERRKEAFDRLLAIAPALEAAGVKPITEEEILAEIAAVRAERRLRGGSAHRS